MTQNTAQHCSHDAEELVDHWLWRQCTDASVFNQWLHWMWLQLQWITHVSRSDWSGDQSETGGVVEQWYAEQNRPALEWELITAQCPHYSTKHDTGVHHPSLSFLRASSTRHQAFKLHNWWLFKVSSPLVWACKDGSKWQLVVEWAPLSSYLCPTLTQDNASMSWPSTTITLQYLK